MTSRFVSLDDRVSVIPEEVAALVGSGDGTRLWLKGAKAGLYVASPLTTVVEALDRARNQGRPMPSAPSPSRRSRFPGGPVYM